jgi:SAM-dependent methyltransferase
MLCPICSHESSLAFTTAFTEVQACSNPDCRHHFSATAIAANKGVYGSVTWSEALYEKWSARNVAMLGNLRDRGLFKSSSSVLDVGFGQGHITKSILAMIDKGKVAGIEAASGADAVADAIGFEYFGDLDWIPDDVQFDMATCVEVIEHVDDPVRMLKGIRRVLAYGGRCFLTTPLGCLSGAPYSDAPKLSAYNTPQHVQFFTRSSFRLACGRAGFQSIDYIAMPEIYSLEPLAPERVATMRASMQLSVDADRNSHLVAIIH